MVVRHLRWVAEGGGSAMPQQYNHLQHTELKRAPSDGVRQIA